MLRALALLVITIAGMVAGLYWLGSTGGHEENTVSAVPRPSTTPSKDAALPATRTLPKAKSGGRNSGDQDSRQPVIETLRTGLRDVTPEGIVDLPRADGETIERLPAVLPPSPPPRPPEPEKWPNPVIEKPGELVSGDTIIALAGIEALRIDETCDAANGGTWPCGRFARTALRRLVRGRTVECDPVKPPETETAPQRIVTRCHTGGHDLSRWLVEQGWARASGSAESNFEKELEAARNAGKGIWGKDRPR